MKKLETSKDFGIEIGQVWQDEDGGRVIIEEVVENAVCCSYDTKGLGVIPREIIARYALLGFHKLIRLANGATIDTYKYDYAIGDNSAPEFWIDCNFGWRPRGRDPHPESFTRTPKEPKREEARELVRFFVYQTDSIWCLDDNNGLYQYTPQDHWRRFDEKEVDISHMHELSPNKLATVEAFLSNLPAVYRERALSQIDAEWVERRHLAGTMAGAISKFCCWDQSKEGSVFWFKMYNAYAKDPKNPKLPPLPVEELPYVDCEVKCDEHGDIRYYDGKGRECGYLLWAVNDPKFIGFVYKDGIVFCGPRLVVGKETPAEIPTHVRFAR